VTQARQIVSDALSGEKPTGSSGSPVDSRPLTPKEIAVPLQSSVGERAA